MLYLRHFLYKMVLKEIAESYGQWDKDGMAEEGYYTILSTWIPIHMREIAEHNNPNHE